MLFYQRLKLLRLQQRLHRRRGTQVALRAPLGLFEPALGLGPEALGPPKRVLANLLFIIFPQFPFTQICLLVLGQWSATSSKQKLMENRNVINRRFTDPFWFYRKPLDTFRLLLDMSPASVAPPDSSRNPALVSSCNCRGHAERPHPQ